MTKHTHHIVPRHMGGSDEPSNLIELTIEEHADAHKKLWEEHGLYEDYLAWTGLSKMVDKQEHIKMVQSFFAKKRLKEKGNPFTGIRTKYNFAVNKDFQKEMTERSMSPEAISKRKDTYKSIKHQQGQSNSQFGTCWIYHNEYGNKKIKQNELDNYLSLGYSKGRKMKTA